MVKRTQQRKRTQRRKNSKKLTKKIDKKVLKDKNVKIFVINLKKDKDRWKKYASNKNYTRFNAVNGSQLPSTEKYLKKMTMMWNASDRQRRNVVGCFLSHLRLLKMVVRKRLNKVIVMEDDAVLDFKALNKVNLNKWPQDKMIYVGGILKPLTMKDKKWSYEKTKKTLKRGLNKIDSKKYKIGATHAYYLPTWQSAKQIVDYLENKDKVRAIDTEFIIMQKTRPDLIEQLYFPALAYLNVGEALEGFTGKAYGIPRDMKQYGGMKGIAARIAAKAAPAKAAAAKAAAVAGPAAAPVPGTAPGPAAAVAAPAPGPAAKAPAPGPAAGPDSLGVKTANEKLSGAEAAHAVETIEGKRVKLENNTVNMIREKLQKQIETNAIQKENAILKQQLANTSKKSFQNPLKKFLINNSDNNNNGGVGDDEGT